MRLIGWTIAIAAAGMATPSQAQMISAKDPRTLVAALQAKGFQAKLGSTAGEPSIESGAGGIKFKIFFENCTGGKACKTVTFITGFTDLDATPAKLNEWNKLNRFTRAYVDKENDPVLAMDVDLDHQGLPAANFGEYVDIWSALASKYVAFLRAP